MVSCGDNHTAAIVVDATNTEKNGSTMVLTWGRGDLGALGIQKPPISSREPIVVVCYLKVAPFHLLITHTQATMNSLKTVQVSCGANHTTILSARGIVFTWGDNSQDQSIAGEAICWTPKRSFV